MRNRQRGISFLVIFLIGVVLALVAVGAMKIAPAYADYMTAKKAIMEVAASDGTGSPSDIRRAFARQADIDNITDVAPGDLDISQDGGNAVISFAYTKKIPLFANVSLLIDFAASTSPGGGADSQ
ncbi:MAG TPA: DUF4845 domain-containing protein [Burkholderiales bacterium]|nr:DUF4845 domain-containing protein [Burkholderiales bacterium]